MRLAERLAMRTRRADAQLGGVHPRRGMVIVDDERRRVYGPIEKVGSDGVVYWRGSYGQLVPTNPSTLYFQRCRYADAPPSGYERLGAIGDSP